MPGPLRSFKAYGNTTPVSPLYLIDAKGTVTESCDRPSNLVNFDGICSAIGYLQVFDSEASPTNGTVPLKSIRVAAAGPLPSYFPSLGPISIAKGLWFAMSTTEATLTTDAGNTYDIWGEIGEFEFQLSGNTVVGDTTTGIDVRQIWSDAFGKSLGQKLVQVDIVNGLNAILYMMIFTKDNPVTNDVPVLPVIKIPIPGVAGTVFKCPFGASGLSVYSQDSNGTKHYGCTIALSTTPIKLTIEGSDASTIRAFYHTQ